MRNKSFQSRFLWLGHEIYSSWPEHVNRGEGTKGGVAVEEATHVGVGSWLQADLSALAFVGAQIKNK